MLFRSGFLASCFRVFFSPTADTLGVPIALPRFAWARFSVFTPQILSSGWARAGLAWAGLGPGPAGTGWAGLVGLGWDGLGWAPLGSGSVSFSNSVLDSFPDSLSDSVSDFVVDSFGFLFRTLL